MRGVGKYILIAFAVVVLEWLWLAAFSSLFNGLGVAGAAVVGVGFFLAFEIVICTGVLIMKISDRTKD